MSLKKYIVEFIGTFFLVLTYCMAIFSKVSADLQPIAVGTMLLGLTYSMGYFSGGQFNPAISLAVYLRGKINIKEMGFYMVAQFVGAAAAAFTTAMLISAKPPVAPIVTPQYFSLASALLAEVLGSFALVWVVLNVATSKSLEGNNFYGLAIGFTVSGLMYTLGSVSGSAFNPAIVVASCITQLSSWNNLWIYLVGCFGGAVLATVVYRYVMNEE